jgi:hypothetical protein
MTQREIVVDRTRSSGWQPNAQIIRLRVKKLWGSPGFSFLGAERTTVTYGWGMARLYPRICGFLLRRLRAGVHLKLDHGQLYQNAKRLLWPSHSMISP